MKLKHIPGAGWVTFKKSTEKRSFWVVMDLNFLPTWQSEKFVPTRLRRNFSLRSECLLWALFDASSYMSLMDFFRS